MNIEQQYIQLMKEILEVGSEKADRTGTGTISVFGRQLRHKMSEGFPLLTTKKVPLRIVATELVWMLQGRTDLRWLLARNCHIWTGDAYKRYATYANSLEEPDWEVHVDDPNENRTRIMTQEEFENEVLMNDAFSEKWGDLGPIYGKQWREWGAKNADGYIKELGYGFENQHTSDLRRAFNAGHRKIDQLANLANDLDSNPDSRRLMVTAWNPADLQDMTLPPCHYGYQAYTRELSLEERGAYYENSYLGLARKKTHEDFDRLGIPKRAISLMWNQRSVDVPLGLPFDIASYALLLEVLAKQTNMVPDELICSLGDCHIYKNQVDGAKIQVTREPYDLPKMEFLDEFHYLFDDLEIPFSDKLDRLREDMFKVKDYQHHSKINYPLSN
jgi:thymidylate synthase